MKIILMKFCLLFILNLTIYPTETVALPGDLVVMLLPENVNPRWENQDAHYFVESMKDIAPEVDVEIVNANNDISAQQRQAEQAITRGAKVLVVIAIDGNAASLIADMAKEENIPVIAYDRMIESEHTSFWVQASMFNTGVSQAQHIIDNTKLGDTIVLLKGSPTDPNAVEIFNGQLSVIKPYFDRKKRINGYESWVQGWDPIIARRAMDQALTKLNNNVQGVLSSNDGNANAAIASLIEQGMAGKIPVTGLDCTVSALQLMILGYQTQSVWRPFDKMARVTAEVVKLLLEDGDFSSYIKGTVSNKLNANIPFIPVEHNSIVGLSGVVNVVAKDKLITRDKICKGDVAKTPFCIDN